MYKLAKLPYDYEELEPFIDTHTLGLHHKKHQQNYLNKLNEILVKNNYDFKYNLVELNFHIDESPKDVQENAPHQPQGSDELRSHLLRQIENNAV